MYELHNACLQGNLSLVKKLLAKKHDCFQLNPNGYSPLSCAVLADQPEIVSYIIEHRAEQSSLSPREIRTKKSVDYHLTAEFFIVQGKNQSALALLVLSANSLESTPIKIDDECRLYIKTLQKIIQLSPTLPASITQQYIQNVLDIHHQIHNKNETDYIIYMLFNHNMAENLRAAGLTKEAKNYYLKSIACYRSLNSQAGQILAKGPQAFYKLSKCYRDDSFESKFFKFAGDCLTKEFKDSLNLPTLLALILNQYSNDVTLCRGAIELINVLFHLYELDTLNNNTLRNFFMKENNQLLLKNLAYSLAIKPIDMAYRPKHFTVFADASFPKDTMHDNLPPTDLSTTYDWM